MMAIFQNEKIWRLLTNLWTFLFLGFVVANFFMQGKYVFLVPPFSALYIGVLTLYVGTKEFDRWYEHHDTRHPGEIFVALWSVIVIFLFGSNVVLGQRYHLDAEVVANYIAVLTIFAVTQKSKKAYERERSHLSSRRKKKL